MQGRVIVVGGGLAGLYTAWRLQQLDIDYLLLEARDRFGGRIHAETVGEGSLNQQTYDLGPSWFWPSFQPEITNLLEQLKLPTFEQYCHGDMLYEAQKGKVIRTNEMSPMKDSYRIEGGSTALISALLQQLDQKVQQLDQNRLLKNQIIRHISQAKDGSLTVATDAEPPGIFNADKIILALPLRLLAQHIKFTPALPPELKQDFIQTATWMAGHAKVIAIYEQAFWREQGLSGEAFSQYGPMTEIHDASPHNGGPYALFGFIGYSAEKRRTLGKQNLENEINEQLERMFGEQAANPIKLVLKDWSLDPYTATDEDSNPLNGHPRYGLSANAQTFLSGKIIFAGTETALNNGGYIEGAINAANQAIHHILK